MHYMKSVRWPQWPDDNRKFVDVPDLDACFAAIRDRVLTQEEMNKSLIEENKRLKSDAYKDEELKKMEAWLNEAKEDLRRGFPISEEENEAIKNWTNKHIIEKHSHLDEDGSRVENYNGAAGGRFEYRFYPTGLGVIGTVKCDCGAEFCFRELE